mgnify:CR=1 FL=1
MIANKQTETEKQQQQQKTSISLSVISRFFFVFFSEKILNENFDNTNNKKPLISNQPNECCFKQTNKQKIKKRWLNFYLFDWFSFSNRKNQHSNSICSNHRKIPSILTPSFYGNLKFFCFCFCFCYVKKMFEYRDKIAHR